MTPIEKTQLVVVAELKRLLLDENLAPEKRLRIVSALAALTGQGYSPTAEQARRYGGLSPEMIAAVDPASDGELQILDAARPLGAIGMLELLKTAVLDRLVALNAGIGRAIAWRAEQDAKRVLPVTEPEQPTQRRAPHVTPPLPEHSGSLHMRALLNQRLERLYYPQPKPPPDTDPWTGAPRHPGGGFRYPTW